MNKSTSNHGTIVNGQSLVRKRNHLSFFVSIIQNQKEQERVKIAFFVAVAILLMPLLMINILPLHSRRIVSFYREAGSIARIGFFFAVALFPIFFLLKKLKALPQTLKKWIQVLAKIARQWHVPVAILSMGIVSVHALLAIFHGFKLEPVYFTGIFAFLMLGLLAFLGMLRYKKLDKNWHLILGLLFVAVFMIHTLFT